ncbi:MAG: putative Na+/H+ antiporter [Parachlamydia sp.]|nr:putative Na+/H+ antiporter [Parachlamydia sp.]
MYNWLLYFLIGTQTSLPFAAGYQDDHLSGIWQRLSSRIDLHPINLLFAACFLLAILHTYAAHRFARRARQRGHREGASMGIVPEGGPEGWKESFWADLLYFFGEVEVVFGVWCLVIFAVAGWLYGWDSVVAYMGSQDYSEAVYVAVALAMASTYPIMRFADKILSGLARLGGGTPLAWWVLLLTLGPLLGALVKESVAMTIVALLLGRHFFACRPSRGLAYATLALLFTNISVSGLFTNFASSAIVVLSKAWNWDTPFMWQTFGWKGIAGIAASNLIYFGLFHRELRQLKSPKVEEDRQREVPWWVTALHLAFLAWITLNSSLPTVVMGAFVLYLGVYQATASYQKFMDLREPLLIGFFLSSLILISGLQVWWIEPVVEGLHEHGLYLASLMLSAFTHNTSNTLLYSHLPHLTEQVKYLLVSAALVGGGMTIMANGPNLMACSLLNDYFDREISFARLFLASLVPAQVLSIFFLVF